MSFLQQEKIQHNVLLVECITHAEHVEHVATGIICTKIGTFFKKGNPANPITKGLIFCILQSLDLITRPCIVVDILHQNETCTVHEAG